MVLDSQLGPWGEDLRLRLGTGFDTGDSYDMAFFRYTVPKGLFRNYKHLRISAFLIKVPVFSENFA